jgi:hypothetical protein
MLFATTRTRKAFTATAAAKGGDQCFPQTKRPLIENNYICKYIIIQLSPWSPLNPLCCLALL